MVNEEITFVLKNGYVKSVISDGTSTIEKNLSLESFGQIANKFANTESEWLPSEYGLQKTKETKNYSYALITTPPRYRQVVYGDKFEILVPALAWFICLRKNGSNSMSMSKSKVFAMKGPVLTTQEFLYLAPFSNVYDNTENICWGHEEGSLRFTNQKGLQSIPDRFFNSEFNNDLDSSRFNKFFSSYSSNTEYFKVNHLFKEANQKIKDEISFEDHLSWIEDTVLRKKNTRIDREWNSFSGEN